jgi:hypothetical protein
MNRRFFLRGGAVAATAVGAATFVPHAIQGAAQRGPLVRQRLVPVSGGVSFTSEHHALRVQVTPTRAVTFCNGFYSTADRIEITALRRISVVKELKGPVSTSEEETE